MGSGAGAASSSTGFFPLVALPEGRRPLVDRRPLPLAADAFFGTGVLFASAEPSVIGAGVVPAFGLGFGLVAVAVDDPLPPISRSTGAPTGVTIPLRNMNSWVPIRIAEETTM